MFIEVNEDILVLLKEKLNSNNKISTIMEIPSFLFYLDTYWITQVLQFSPVFDLGTSNYICVI